MSYRDFLNESVPMAITQAILLIIFLGFFRTLGEDLIKNLQFTVLFIA